MWSGVYSFRCTAALRVKWGRPLGWAYRSLAASDAIFARGERR
jgi:hypothetical protein